MDSVYLKGEMSQQWIPSLLGRCMTRSAAWTLRLDGRVLSLTMAGHTYAVDVEDESAYRIRRGLLWTDVALLGDPAGDVVVDGLPNARAASLAAALATALTAKRLRDDVALLHDAHAAMQGWYSRKSALEQMTRARHRWVTHDMRAALEASRPVVDVTQVRARMQRAGVRLALGDDAARIDACLARWGEDLSPHWQVFNAAHVEAELQACRALFDQVEKSPLTQEQARAVICFENRVQVVASAGSGKTSTMVAKAVYAVHRRLVAPERIVMMAFNKQAAQELSARMARSLKRLGIADVAVKASTFHAMGLGIIGKATGKKPDVPDWAIDPAGGVRKLMELIDELKDRAPMFRLKWDLFRFVFARDLPPFGSKDEPDTWQGAGCGGILTADGKQVKSQEEAMLANWLFYNGVAYRYEDPYRFETADEDHRQYRPDFYYPDIDLYHEHFALDAQGVAPAHFEGYVAGVEWKRALHRAQGTALIETTSYQIRTGEVFEHLARALTDRGIVLDPNPDRAIPSGGQKPLEQKDLIGLMRTFISHAKSNCLDDPALRERLEAMPASTFKFRHGMFLDLFAPILQAWDAALAAEGGIDFEDMLNLAAEHVERGRYEPPYDLVMADEFQDASRARARLCRAMVQKSDRHLFAVGDDWQSINRFAGADVSVMTRFRDWYGHGEVLKLERTFRCPQALCDVSGRFIARNPAQMRKAVHSTTPAEGPVLQAFQVDADKELAQAIERYVMHLAAGVRDGTIPPGRDGKVSVYVLGRYRTDRKYLPVVTAECQPWVDVSFCTIHRSKGSEADYVILPEMVSVLRKRSFPNTQAEDPVMALAMPTGDAFPLGEERRLFYVALTRARRRVAMFTVRGRTSVFLQELRDDGAVSIERPDGRPIQEECCTWCKRGVLVLRKGGYGPFLGCTNYPDCRYTRKVRGETTARSDGPIVENRSREVPQAPADPLAALGALGRRIATARARHADATAPLASVPDVAPRRVADD